MKRFIFITTMLLYYSSATVFAQFNTVTQTKAHRKVVPKNFLPQSSEQQPPCSPYQRRNTISIVQSHNKQAERTGSHKGVSYPLCKIIVTSPYGVRTDPFTKKKAKHNGLDLRANYEPAYAMFYGKVIKIGSDRRSGKFVTLRHSDLTVSYCHLSHITVAVGSVVHPGDIIAVTGNTGRSCGAHLHLTCKNKGKTVSPASILHLIQKELGDNS